MPSKPSEITFPRLHIRLPGTSPLRDLETCDDLARLEIDGDHFGAGQGEEVSLVAEEPAAAGHTVVRQVHGAAAPGPFAVRQSQGLDGVAAHQHHLLFVGAGHEQVVAAGTPPHELAVA